MVLFNFSYQRSRLFSEADPFNPMISVIRNPVDSRLSAWNFNTKSIPSSRLALRARYRFRPPQQLRLTFR